MPSVTVDPTLPLQVMVDFQSRHRAAFRLFVRGASPGAEPRFLKEGIADASAIVASPPPGGAIVYEFIFFSEPSEFQAVLVFRQNGQLLVPGGVVPVLGRGDALFLGGEVDIQ